MVIRSVARIARPVVIRSSASELALAGLALSERGLLELSLLVRDDTPRWPAVVGVGYVPGGF